MVKIRNAAIIEVCQAGKTAPPLATPLPEQQILLLRDNIGVFTYFDGRPTGRAVVTFTEPPIAIAYNAPYVVAALPRGIEVRGIGAANGLAQLLPYGKGTLFFAVGDDVGAVRSDGTTSSSTASSTASRAVSSSSAADDGDEFGTATTAAAAGADDSASNVLLFAAAPERLMRMRPIPLGEQCERLVRERRVSMIVSVAVRLRNGQSFVEQHSLTKRCRCAMRCRPTRERAAIGCARSSVCTRSTSSRRAPRSTARWR